MYETISDEDLINVVGGVCGCCQQPQQADQSAGGTAGGGAPTAGPTQPTGAPAPSTGGQPGGGCDQLLQAITQLLNLFGGMNAGGAPQPPQPQPTAGA